MFSRLSTTLAIISSSFIINGQVLINEVHLKPLTSASDHIDQSLAHTTAGWGKEFIEIYNTTCATIDIGCWVISSESFGTTTRDGSYRFPVGTTIGPKAFISLGGPGSGAGINLSTLFSDPHMATGDANRWYLDNGDCYVALFDDTGAPMDAVFWTVSSGESSKWATDSDLDDPVSQIPNPPGCGVIGSFADPSGANITAVVEYAGQSPSIGSSLARVQDGGVWTNTGTPSPSGTNGVFDPCAPLPVELIGFNVSCISEQVHLSWQTATEINNDYFEIQQSINGYDYNSIIKIDGAGNSTTLNSYEYQVTDREMLKGYYRLKQVDFDGAFEYSNSKYADCQSNEPFVQIVNGQLVVSHTEPIVNCKIYDLTGRIIHDSPLVEDFNAYSANSFYFVHITTKSGFTIHKVFNN